MTGPNDLQDKATHQVVVGMEVGHKHSLQIPENVSSLLAKVTIQLPRGPLPAVQDQSGIVPTDHTTLGSHDKHGCQTLENVTSLFTTVIVQLRSPPPSPNENGSILRNITIPDSQGNETAFRLLRIPTNDTTPGSHDKRSLHTLEDVSSLLPQGL